jgi:cell wall-associated NlpC family hydrolase
MVWEMPGRSHVRTSWRAAVAVVVATASVTVIPGRSGADQIASKRGEARALEAKIEAQGERLSILVERYNQARLNTERVTMAAFDAKRRLDGVHRDAVNLRGEVRKRALSLYTGAGVPAPLLAFAAHDATELGIRSKYVAAVAARDGAALEQLRATTEDLQLEQARLSQAQQAATASQRDLDTQRRAAGAAMAEQRALLDKVQGELARLIAEEEARRRAEATRRAREALARRFRSSRGLPSDIANVPAPNARAGTAVDTAKAQIGKPYEWGAAGPGSYDCSGLTMYAWGRAGVSLPHSSSAQYSSLPHLDISQIAPGDLLFFGHPIHHVGIYIGGGQMVNAPQTGENVRVDSIYRGGYVGAGRAG